MTNLPASAARRIFLEAQGLARARARSRPGAAQFRGYLARQGVLQLDSVNVLARAHYMPLFSRYGAYDLAALDSHLWNSGENFEHWGHEASVMPRSLLPALRHRMEEPTSWFHGQAAKLEARRPGYLGEVRAHVEAHGPLVAADIDQEPRTGGGSWWNHSDAKHALELLFHHGEVAVHGRPGFRRTYDSPARVWGQDATAPALGPQEAAQALFERGLAATGIGTPKDIADHFRLPARDAKAMADVAVVSGAAQWVDVVGWGQPALLATGAQDPGRATASALLSPFDPVCWYRPRLERMFGMQYRIEIYTPEPKREYGYYVLPFLMGDHMAARVDLKADRKAGVLLVQAAWHEPAGAPTDAGRRGKPKSADAVAASLARELGTMAGWLGLEGIEVRPRGTLAPALTAAIDAR